MFIHLLPMSLRTALLHIDHLVFPAYLPQAGCAVIKKCKQKDRLKKGVLSLQRRHPRALGRY